MRHLDAVVSEPVVVVWFPWGPISEGDHVPVGPGEEPGRSQVIQASPHITGGCHGPKQKRLIQIVCSKLLLKHGMGSFPYPCTGSSPASSALSST